MSLLPFLRRRRRARSSTCFVRSYGWWCSETWLRSALLGWFYQLRAPRENTTIVDLDGAQWFLESPITVSSSVRHTSDRFFLSRYYAAIFKRLDPISKILRRLFLEDLLKNRGRKERRNNRWIERNINWLLNGAIIQRNDRNISVEVIITWL